MTVTSDIINSALCGLDTTLHTVEIDNLTNLGPNIQCTRLPLCKSNVWA